jgi:hypothetical protein
MDKSRWLHHLVNWKAESWKSQFRKISKGLLPLGYSSHSCIHNVLMTPWKTLLNKAHAPNKGGKQKQRERERGPKSEADAQKPQGWSQRGKGTTNYISEPPPVSRNISEKKREGNPKAQDCSCDRSSLWKAIGMGPITTVASYCIAAMG